MKNVPKKKNIKKKKKEKKERKKMGRVAMRVYEQKKGKQKGAEGCKPS